MRSQNTINGALQGIRAVYHICPNVSPDEYNIGQIVIQGAQSARVDHLVYHSVLHPQVESMPHHWQKMRVEEQLFESGLSYTILQPAVYMQNILAYWSSIVEDSEYPVPYSENAQLSFVDLEDVTEVAAMVLCESGHKGAIYELCGTKIHSPIDLTQLLSQYLGHKIDVNIIPYDKWESGARRNGLGDYQVNSLIKMFRYYEQFGFSGNPHILACLLGRSPTSFETFIERTIRERS
jgi:uncharacterized protein YbjT (DUF2867 family)